MTVEEIPRSPTWRERIAEAKKTGGFRQTDKDDAGNWNTCKIGEKYHLKGKGYMLNSEIGDQFGQKAEQLGMLFTHAIQTDNVEEAAKLCAEIDAL